MVWYHLMYDVEGGELRRAQSFEDEWKLIEYGKVNRNQIVRGLVAIIILSLF